MDYALAKDLKDAGFPQEGKGNHLFHPDDIKTTTDGAMIIKGATGISAYAPTLSELIDACGTAFGSLARNGSFRLGTILNDPWVVWASASQEADQVGGNTPEEAIARLWLMLKSK